MKFIFKGLFMKFELELAFIGHFNPINLSEQLGIESTMCLHKNSSLIKYKNPQLHQNDKFKYDGALAMWKYAITEEYGHLSLLDSIDVLYEIFYKGYQSIHDLIVFFDDASKKNTYFYELLDMKNICNDIAFGAIMLKIKDHRQAQIEIDASRLNKCILLSNFLNICFDCLDDNLHISSDDDIENSLFIEYQMNSSSIQHESGFRIGGPLTDEGYNGYFSELINFIANAQKKERLKIDFFVDAIGMFSLHVSQLHEILKAVKLLNVKCHCIRPGH